jgi:hypothetical protein
MLGSFPRVLERRVVLIDKNGNLEPCLLIGGFNDEVEAVS